MTKVLCIGDIMLDVTAVTGRELEQGVETRAHISTQGGGAAANVASWLAHTGTPTYLVTRVGDDAAGRTLLDELDRYGVEHSTTLIEGLSTGVVIVIVDALGERTMFPDSGANAGLGLADLPDLAEFTTLYLSGYPLINPISRPGVLQIIEKAKSIGLPIVFDPATVGVLREVGIPTVREWLKNMDVLILNEEEGHFLSGIANPIDAAAALLELVPTVIIKRGGTGALAQSRDCSLVQVQAVATDVVNTTGAGDAFAAGFIQVWGETRDSTNLEAAITRGAALGSQCVAHIGARPLVAPR
jgi:sugar/nucleoside kinase (ribokinase family)